MSIFWRPHKPKEQDFDALEKLLPKSGILLLGPNWGCEVSRESDWKSQLAEDFCKTTTPVFINRDPTEDIGDDGMSPDDKAYWWNLLLQKTSVIVFWFPSYGKGDAFAFSQAQSCFDVDELYALWADKQIPTGLSFVVGSDSPGLCHAPFFNIFVEWLPAENTPEGKRVFSSLLDLRSHLQERLL